MPNGTGTEQPPLTPCIGVWRAQAKQFALQVQLVDLQERLKELELERTQHRAQLDALSQCMRNVSCVQPPRPVADRLAEACPPMTIPCPLQLPLAA